VVSAGVDRYLSGDYLRRNPDWHDADAVWKARQIAELLVDVRLSPRTLCDIGCGSGGVLAELHRLLPHAAISGYELSPQAVRIAAARHPDIPVEHIGALQVDRRFDVVLLLDVFEHVEDYLGFLRRIRTTGDRFLFHIPLDLSVQLLVRRGRLLRKREEVGHLHYFSKDTALASLEDAGYRIDTWRYTTPGIDGPDPTWRMRLLRGPRRMGHRLAPDLSATLFGGFSLLVLATPADGVLGIGRERAHPGDP